MTSSCTSWTTNPSKSLCLSDVLVRKNVFFFCIYFHLFGFHEIAYPRLKKLELAMKPMETWTQLCESSSLLRGKLSLQYSILFTAQKFCKHLRLLEKIKSMCCRIQENWTMLFRHFFTFAYHVRNGSLILTEKHP